MTPNNNFTIGVLALQGCVYPHRPHIEAMGDAFKAVKTEQDLKQVDGLILPGGESTTMLKLINAFKLKDVLVEYFKDHPVWGICAGTILMAKTVTNPEQDSFGLINMDVERNSYGRQLESTHYKIEGYPVSFIRAPRISCNTPDIHVHARRDDDPVWIEYDHYMATTFHPEMTLQFPSPMHTAFHNLIADKN